MHVHLKSLTDSKIPAKVLLSSIAFVTKGVVTGSDMPFYAHILFDDVFVTNNELFVNRYFIKLDIVDVVREPDILALLKKPDSAIYINPDAIEFCGVISTFKPDNNKKRLVKINIKTFEFICSVDLDIFFYALCRAAEGKMYFVKASLHENDADGIIDNGEKNIILSASNILTIKPYGDESSYLVMKNGKRLIVEKTIDSF